MKLLVLLPHADPTLRPIAPQGWTLHDAAEQFSQRASSPESLEALADGLLKSADSDSLRRALLLRAAASMLKRDPPTHARLRALGAAFSGASAGELELRLDDLELRAGSTERGSDLQVAASGGLPFAEELARAVDAARDASCVRLWIERDQQLPAALAFAQALPQVELDGPFARRHSVALGQLLSRATIASDTVPLKQQVQGLSWREDGATTLPSEPWAGHVTVAELAALSTEGCRAATVAICAVGTEDVIGADGSRVPLPRFQQSLQRWADAGVTLFFEWWVGAPGESLDSHHATLAAIDAGALNPLQLIGLRPFHWSRHRAQDAFAGREVSFGTPALDRDLARSIPFESPGSLSPEERTALIEQLAASAAERHPLVPGRVALAYAVPAEHDAPRGPLIRLAPDAAIVSLPSSLDGKPQLTWYAVQLRKRTTLTLDPRIAPALAALTSARAPAEALPQFSAALREKVVRQLADKRILEEVEA